MREPTALISEPAAISARPLDRSRVDSPLEGRRRRRLGPRVIQSSANGGCPCDLKLIRQARFEQHWGTRADATVARLVDIQNRQLIDTSKPAIK